MPPLTLRIRTQVGTWRLANISSNDTFRDVRERLEKEHNVVFKSNVLSMDPGRTVMLSDDLSVKDAGLRNGDMLYAEVDEEQVGAHDQSTGKKKITKDGKIVIQDTPSELQRTGFRPGMMALRDIKMKWTLAEFVSLDDQFTYKIKHQEKSVCKKVSTDATAIDTFQNYVRSLDFRSIRAGFLYGSFNADDTVKVEVVYEPPQESTETTFHVWEDPKEEKIKMLLDNLGLKKVGWIFAHPPREKGFFFSGPEVLFTAEQQLEAADGVADTPFVTIKVTLDENAQAVVEAFQVSKQCMEMIAEGVLQPSVNLGSCTVSDTFTAIVEGKPAKEVDNNFFLSTVPIERFDSQFLTSQFPPSNRVDMPTVDHLKRQLSKYDIICITLFQ
jgi:nuclear protein localization family protein 4